MTREKEDELLATRRELRRKAKAMIQRIVEARMRGERDGEAIIELGRLSAAEVKMTKPDLSLVA